MTHRPQNPAVRRAARILALVPALAVTSLTSTAVADAPDQWENNPAVSPLHALLVLAVIPIGLFVLITLLVYLPSTWVGGPRAGIDAVEAAPPAVETRSQRGGTSGHW